MAPLPVRAHPLFHRASSPSSSFSPPRASANSSNSDASRNLADQTTSKMTSYGMAKNENGHGSLCNDDSDSDNIKAERELRKKKLKETIEKRDETQSDLDLHQALLASINPEKDPGYTNELRKQIQYLERQRNLLSREIDQARKRNFSSSASKPKGQKSLLYTSSSSSPFSKQTTTSRSSPSSPLTNMSFPFSYENGGFVSPFAANANASFNPVNRDREGGSLAQPQTQAQHTFQQLQAQGQQVNLTPTTPFDVGFEMGGMPDANEDSQLAAGTKRPYSNANGNVLLDPNTGYLAQRPVRRQKQSEVIDLTGEPDLVFDGLPSTHTVPRTQPDQTGGNLFGTHQNFNQDNIFGQSSFSAQSYPQFSTGRQFGSDTGTGAQNTTFGAGFVMPGSYQKFQNAATGPYGGIQPYNPIDMSGSYRRFQDFPPSAPSQQVSSPTPTLQQPPYSQPPNYPSQVPQGLADIANRTNILSHPGGLDYADPNVRRILLGVNEPNDAEVKKEIDNLLANITPRSEDGSVEPREQTPEAMKHQLYEHQKIALRWMIEREKGGSKGGILADDMGLGKTISALALIASCRAKDKSRKTTLIVGPVAIVRQWRQEIKDKIQLSHKLSVFLHHGTSKKATFEELRDYDVVLTTYGVLSAEFKRMDGHMVKNGMTLKDTENDTYLRKNCPLLHIKSKWYRVMLDESQCVKNKNAQCSKAVRQIDSTYRWCLTGTPMMNNVEELYSLIAFLNIEPYCVYERFQASFRCLSPGRGGNSYGRLKAMKKLQALLVLIMMRRTKKSKIDGKPIIELPEKYEEQTYVVFDEDEERYYRGLENRNADIFNKYNRQGTVGKNYAVMLVLLLRLRQACCHPHLNTDVEPVPSDDELQKQLTQVHAITEDAIANIKRGVKTDAFICGACDDAAPSPIFFSPCGHAICEACMARQRADVEAENIRIGQDSGSDYSACPSCSIPLRLRDTFRLAAFKTVYMPERLKSNDPQLMNDSDSDSDDDDDAELDVDGKVKDEVDEKGNLKDFIVDDEDDESTDEIPDSQESTTEMDELSALATDMDEPSTLTNPTTPGSTTDAKDQIKYENMDDDSDSEVDVDAEIARAYEAIRPKPSSRVTIEPLHITAKKTAAARKGRLMKKKRPKVSIKDVQATELGILRKDAQKNKLAREKYMRYLKKNWQPSAKVTKTAELLMQICEEKREKVIIFSSFTGLLDLLEIPLMHELRIKYERFDGGMSGDARDKALTAFREDKNVKVLLVSLKAGNAGLNLTVANNVIIMDPYWNPFIEMQAVDRTYRIGQMKNVRVHRILVKNTIEDRILALQDAKKELVEAALDESKTASLTKLSTKELGYLFGVNSDY